MASNTNPEEARKAQDVEAPVHSGKEKTGTFHWGRGGEGNMMTVGQGFERGEKGTIKQREEGKVGQL